MSGIQRPSLVSGYLTRVILFFYGGVVRTPEHEAYLFMERICRKNGTKWKDYEDIYSEQLNLARSYKRIYMRKYNLSKRKPKRITYNHLEKLPWYEITTYYSAYSYLVKKKRNTGEHEGLREINNYYVNITSKNRNKRLLHPDISESSLGPDPRIRDWPSGRIQYKLYSYLKS